MLACASDPKPKADPRTPIADAIAARLIPPVSFPIIAVYRSTSTAENILAVYASSWVVPAVSMNHKRLGWRSTAARHDRDCTSVRLAPTRDATSQLTRLARSAAARKGGGPPSDSTGWGGFDLRGK